MRGRIAHAEGLFRAGAQLHPDTRLRWQNGRNGLLCKSIRRAGRPGCGRIIGSPPTPLAHPNSSGNLPRMIQQERPLDTTELDRLEQLLISDVFHEQAMPLDMLQGLLCAVASAPDLIPPSRWLP